MFERIKQLVIKELTQILRDPKMKMVIFIVPIIQIVIFGFAVSTDVKDVRTVVYDLDNTAESRDLVREFTYSKYFSIRDYIHTDKQQEALIDRSLAQAVIRINRGFARDIEAERPAEFQFIVDGTDSNTAGIILSYASGIVQRYSSKLLEKRFGYIAKTQGKAPQIDLRMRAWYNENLVSRNFFVPGLLGLILVLTILLTAMAIVREKESGTIEQLMVTPIRPVELILGKLLPFIAVGLVDTLLIITFSVLIFGVPIKGSLFLLFVCSTLYLLNTLGLGLFISIVSKTQQEALLSTFFISFPTVLLSGFVFPIESMPVAIQHLTLLDPLRYFTVIIRGIILKGIGIRILWPQMAALLFIGLVILTMSSWSFKRSIR
jgi:ABC-2 type transport system permease protein